MFYRPWQTVRPDPARSAALSAALGMPRLVCDVMCARGLDTPEAARAMCGGGDALSDPMLLSGMEAAVARIHRAIDDGERIAVFGDYDVDGVTATALLYTYLDSAGADVYYKLPSRDDDGYGLSETAVDLMAAKGVSLIVTVDNGVSANAAIAHAKEQGVDVVVTDHHLPPQTLPEAAAIVNPQLPGDESPCKTLSGAGVAFKLAAALDGCTGFSKIFRIILPNISFMIFIQLIMCVITTMQLLDAPYMYASGGPSGASTTQGIFIYNAFNQDLNYGRGSAASIVLLFVIAGLTMLQMHFEKSEKE